MHALKVLMAALGLGLLVLAGPLAAADKDDGWTVLFNGKDLTGWQLRATSYTITKFVNGAGAEIPGAKKGKLDQIEIVVDAKNQPIKDAKVAEVSGKKTPVDAAGQPIKDAKVTKSGGRDAIVDKDGKELKEAKAVNETVPNPTGGWKVENGLLICGNGPRGVDMFTDAKFTDFQLHVEFLGTGNSGVYLQGRYEIQVDNSFNAKPKIQEIDGKKVEVFANTQCGALYGQIAPSKNMAKPPTEWQAFDITFHGARGEKGKVSKKARVTLIWNGEKVIDDAEIPNGTALDPGPVLLQGDHGKVTFRNIKIKPLEGK
jgi:hypothetical protein